MIKLEIKTKIESILKEKYEKFSSFDIEIPKDFKNGDYACNVAMILSKKLQKNPRDLAQEIIQKLGDDSVFMANFSRVEIAGPGFINFYLSENFLLNGLRSVLDNKSSFGNFSFGEGKTVLVDFSSINIAKPMHVGHLRSTIIGQSLSNIYKALGYRVISDNHIGDWGTQFGKMIYAYKNWGDKKKISKEPIEEMNKLYVRFHKESQKNEKLDEFARLETTKLQSGDEENRKIWEFFVKESLKEADKIYKTLGVDFDYVLGESFYNDMLSGIVDDAISNGVAKESEGAVIIDLEKEKLPPLLIKKSDGGYLYSTTDIATAKYREEKFKPDIVLYVVSNEQSLYFEQLFASFKKLGISNGKNLQHVKFGMVLGDDGKKFSTRKGEAVKLEDLIKEAMIAARNVLENKNPEISEKDKKNISKVIGLGAMKYNDLSQNRLTDITFNWDKMLSFEGNSAPYLQYTYTRIKSLEENYNKKFLADMTEADLSLLNKEEEIAIIRQIVKYYDAISSAARENSPHIIALYLYNLANAYNSFYSNFSILGEGEDIAKARTNLSMSVGIVLKSGLSVLGIDVVDRM